MAATRRATGTDPATAVHRAPVTRPLRALRGRRRATTTSKARGIAVASRRNGTPVTGVWQVCPLRYGCAAPRRLAWPCWLQTAIELREPDIRDLVRFLAGLVADLLRGRAALIAENGLLRHQLIVAERKLVGRVRWAPWQRFTMGLAAQLVPAWRSATLFVQPATILRWHRAGFRVFWRRRSRPQGRPPTRNANLIRHMGV